MKENPVLMRTITELLDAAETVAPGDRMLFIAIAGDLAINLESASNAIRVASRFLQIVHGPDLTGKGAALMTIVELIAKFRRNSIFKPLVENAHNEIALCALSAQDKHVRATAFRVLGQSYPEMVK